MAPSTPPSAAEQLRIGAEGLVRAKSDIEVAAALNDAIAPFLVWPYGAGPISVRELENNGDSVYQAAIYTKETAEEQEGTVALNASSVACVFHTAHTLTIEELRAAYHRIGAVKRIQRPPRTTGSYPVNDVPLGIVCCIDSVTSLEQVAEAMMEVNKTAASTEWPDMIVVLRKGTVNYAIQIEGDKIGSDFLLPNTTGSPVMPMYVHVFSRGLGLHSLNRLLGFLFLHLEIYSPGTKLPHKAVLEGTSQMGMTIGAYQFNLRGQLVPVPEEMRTDKGAGLRNLPFRIESREGKLQSHVQFIPWQEGGAIRVIGKLPLETFLVFLGPVMKGAQIIEQKGARISSILPITRQDFLISLQRFQSQSNMIVKPEQPSWIVSKMSDEGSSSPFMARLFMGVLTIRDRVFLERKDRESFDKPYENALTALSDARATAKEIDRLLKEHKQKVSTGEAARLVGKTIHVDGIDKELRKNIADFATSAGRSLKTGMQALTKALNLDIGFLFKEHGQFEKGIVRLFLSHPERADYLREARGWTERLSLLRNRIEHEGWTLARAGYRENNGKIEMLEPEIEGQTVSEFVRYTLDRLCCFVEEVTIYGLRTKMDPMISVAEIPRSERDPNAPERFRPALAVGGTPLWKLTYHATTFDEV
jgi:hypothetical protein